MLHAIVANVFGCLDNLALVWVHEKQVKRSDGRALRRKQISLQSEFVRASFPEGLVTYIKSDEFQAWYKSIELIRDTLAHRVPFHIPPFSLKPEDAPKFQKLFAARPKVAGTPKFGELTAEMDKLKTFHPFIAPSPKDEGRPIVFHPTLIGAVASVTEIGNRVLHALESK